MHADSVAVLDGATDVVDAREVDHRVDALAVEVQPERHEVDVAAALAVAEQAALDALRAGEHGQFGVGGGRSPVVVGVDGQADVLAAREVPAHPLDLVGVDVRGRALDGARQVQDDLAVRAGLPDIHDALADLEREVELGVHEDLGGVLEPEVGVRQVDVGVLHDRLDTVDGDCAALGPSVAVPPEDDAAKDGCGGVVHVHRRLLRTDQRGDRALDEFLTGLGEDGDADVVGYAPGLDEAADEVEVGLAGGREADLDLLVADRYEQVEHRVLAGGVHRVDQRLIAVAQVGREPARRSVIDLLGQVRSADRPGGTAGSGGRASPKDAAGRACWRDGS